MDEDEKASEFFDLLAKTRDERLELLPEAGSFVEVIADAMNALQVAYGVVMINAYKRAAPRETETTFVPVSNPQDAKNL